MTGSPQRTAYISIPIKRARESFIIEGALQGIGIKVNNPCRIDDAHGPKDQIPRRVVNECISMMKGSDLGVILLDYFGRDCAFEVGFMNASGIPVYGVYVDKSSRTEDCPRELKQYRGTLSEEFDSVEALIEFLKGRN
jgi:nucleoside 2-deoxyribosyltransferase